MFPNQPQIIYLILILPTLFGLTLIGDGIYKLTQEEKIGWVSIIFGGVFVIGVIFVFFFFSSFIK